MQNFQIVIELEKIRFSFQSDKKIIVQLSDSSKIQFQRMKLEQNLRFDFNPRYQKIKQIFVTSQYECSILSSDPQNSDNHSTLWVVSFKDEYNFRSNWNKAYEQSSFVHEIKNHKESDQSIIERRVRDYIRKYFAQRQQRISIEQYQFQILFQLQQLRRKWKQQMKDLSAGMQNNNILNASKISSFSFVNNFSIEIQSFQMGISDQSHQNRLPVNNFLGGWKKIEIFSDNFGEDYLRVENACLSLDDIQLFQAILTQIGDIRQ